MDPQTSAVFESPTVIKYGLSELNFNAVNRSTSNPKVNKHHEDGKKLSSASSASNSSHNKRFVIYPTAGPSGKVSGDSSSSGGHSSLMTSPIMSPSPSMVNTVKHHGSMRSIRSGMGIFRGWEGHANLRTNNNNWGSQNTSYIGSFLNARLLTKSTVCCTNHKF